MVFEEKVDLKAFWERLEILVIILRTNLVSSDLNVIGTTDKGGMEGDSEKFVVSCQASMFENDQNASTKWHHFLYLNFNDFL